MRLLPVSATYKNPSLSAAMWRGALRLAAPLPEATPVNVPWPNTLVAALPLSALVKVPFVVGKYRTRLSARSDTSSPLVAENARPYGRFILNCEGSVNFDVKSLCPRTRSAASSAGEEAEKGAGNRSTRALRESAT